MKKDNEKRAFNIFDHELVPRHELLPKKEAEELLRDYHIQPHQLPYIKSNDPAVEAIGGKPGDIVKITRRSSTAGESVVYRFVIET